MKSIQILFGFEDPKFEQAVKELLKSKGYDADIRTRFSKLTIKEFLDNNTDCNTVVLKEAFSKDVFYSAEEIAQFTEKRDINVIIVLSEKHKGTDFMRTLHAAGITNAMLQKGRRGGVTPREVASLILQRRSRKEAREYYGIGSQKIEFGFLDETTYVEFYQDLKKPGVSLLENYVDVCARMSPQQIADFTRRLPKDDIDDLVRYEEFHVIMQLLKKFGIDLKIKKPKKVEIGLRTPASIGMKDEKITKETPVEVTEAKVEESVKKTESVMDKKVESKEPENLTGGMSLSALFGYASDEETKDDLQKEDEVQEEAVPFVIKAPVSDEEKTAPTETVNEPKTTPFKIREVDEEVEDAEDEEEISAETSVDVAVEVFDAEPEDDEEEMAVIVEEEEVVSEELPKEVTEEVPPIVKEQEVVEEPDFLKDIVSTQTSKMMEEMLVGKWEASAKEEPIKKEKEEKSVPQIVFSDYDSAYDDLSLDYGSGPYINTPLIFSLAFLGLTVGVIYLISSGYIQF